MYSTVNIETAWRGSSVLHLHDLRGRRSVPLGRPLLGGFAFASSCRRSVTSDWTPVAGHKPVRRHGCRASDSRRGARRMFRCPWIWSLWGESGTPGEWRVTRGDRTINPKLRRAKTYRCRRWRRRSIGRWGRGLRWLPWRRTSPFCSGWPSDSNLQKGVCVCVCETKLVSVESRFFQFSLYYSLTFETVHIKMFFLIVKVSFYI